MTAPPDSPLDRAAEGLLEKLRLFTSTLDEHERALLGALIGPGIVQAYAATEVEGFGLDGWSADDLPGALAHALHDAGVRVEGLGL